MTMKRIVLTGFVLLTGITQAQVKKTQLKTKTKKEWVNPVKLTKEERNRPYMDEVLKTRDLPIKKLAAYIAQTQRYTIKMGEELYFWVFHKATTHVILIIILQKVSSVELATSTPQIFLEATTLMAVKSSSTFAIFGL